VDAASAEKLETPKVTKESIDVDEASAEKLETPKVKKTAKPKKSPVIMVKGTKKPAQPAKNTPVQAGRTRRSANASTKNIFVKAGRTRRSTNASTKNPSVQARRILSSTGVSTEDTSPREIASAEKNDLDDQLQQWKLDKLSNDQSPDTDVEKACKRELVRRHYSPGRVENTGRRTLIRLIQNGKLAEAERRAALKKLRSQLIGTYPVRDRPSDFDPRGRVSTIKDAILRREVGSRQKSKPGGHISFPLKSKQPRVHDQPGPVVAKKGTTAHEIKSINTDDLKLAPLDSGSLNVPSLSYGLERVLFNPGVYHLQDPRSRVFNFDPYLQSIMPVSEFDFNALKQYITSSRDKTLLATAIAEKKKYTGSTSSMTSALAHFHFLLSQWRPINTGTLSQMFPVEYNTFTALQRGPQAVFLRWKDGVYAIDADKQYDTANILSMLGKSMEKLLTLSTEDFEKYRKANSDQISEEERNESEEFHYTTIGDFLLRSQLDAHDPRLPGTGMFDLKTRAVVGVRMALEEYEEGSGYQIRGRHGEWESFEREYYDMIRAAFLKYSLQVRMGRMDGIFVAFHNTERVFGFQYISLPEMDYAIHGTEDITLGDSEFKLSLELLNRVLDRATSKFPEKTLRLHFETRDAPTPFMYIFAEPIEEEEVDKIQATNKAKIEEFESRVLGLVNDDMSDERRQAEWESLRAEVEQSMERDEVEPEDAEGEREDSELETISAEEQREIDELLSSTASEEPEEDEEDDEVIEEEAEEDKVMDEVIEEEVEEDDEEIADENSDENSDELEETHESADEDGLEEQQIGIDEEKEKEIDAMEEDNAPGAEEESNVEEAEELGSEDSESDSAEQVELVENEDLVPDESAESNVIDEDTENPKASQSDAESGEAVQQPIWDGEVKETKSRRRKASGGDHDTVTISGEDNVLAMTLTIRNKVNGRYVDRPNNINEKTDWLVEYALAEVPSSQQANKLYAAAKLRREQVLTKAKDKGQDDRNNIFIENIKKLSRKGREWLKRQEKLEADLPVKTLDDPTGGKKSGVWAGQKQEKE
jgi:hypothetical protein